MPLSPGTRLGPYEIVAPLGAGGMGEVYRARDSRLGRDVAVKVLPQHLSDNPEVRARFEREAKTVSALNHPNICTLHDVGRASGVAGPGDTDYLVMELVEGETLAQRLAKGPLALAEVVKLGAQVADALDRAHRAGVIHRDLKPGNVMLTRGGAKLMDFGLARSTGLAGPAGGSGVTHAALTQSPTIAGPLTAEGTIVGTFQYMSPEQLEGREADARSDIWALGCVLYEMTSGRRAFEGTSQASLIGSIMNAAPRPLSEMAPTSPPELDRLVRQCLARDPDDRWQSARDLGRELASLVSESGVVRAPQLSPAARRGAWGDARLPWALSALLLLLLVAGGAWFARMQGAGRARHVVSTLLPPRGFAFSVRSGPMAFSPDGSQIAFVVEDSLGATSLWVRSLDASEPRLVPGTVGAAMPFWSPDGHNLGYFADGQLRRTNLSGGAAQVLTSTGLAVGGVWPRNDYILFAESLGRGVMRVPATGGDCTRLLDSARTVMARNPAFPVMLPDGRHFLFAAYVGQMYEGVQDGIYVGPTDGRTPPRLLLPGATAAQLVRPGRLFFWRDGALWEQSFDAGSAKLSGVAVQVAGEVMFDSWLGGAFFSVSPSGNLVYLRGSANAGLAELAWVDRAGRDLSRLAPPANYYSPRLSHDGRKVAVDRSDPISGEGDIWVFDVARTLGDRVTSNPLNETSPAWSNDDSYLYWTSSVGAPRSGAIHGRRLDGTGTEETLLQNENRIAPLDVSHDGRTLLFQRRIPGSATLGRLQLLSLPDRKVSPWPSTSGGESYGRISPDGHWIALVSGETGQDEVYVERFPQGGEKWRVSAAGGTGAAWRGDGRELYFYSPDHYLMSATFRAQPGPELGVPVPLFHTQLRSWGSNAFFDVTSDGQRFLLDRPVRADARSALTLEQGWTPPR
jgi:Tol biopolymer transport system component